MELMTGRYKKLVFSFEGLSRGAPSLVGHDGTKYLPGSGADDPGLFYFVPKIGQLFHIGIDQALFVFFFSLITFSCAIAAVSLYASCKSRLARLLILPTLALQALLCYFVWDVYLISACAILSTVPLYFYFQKRAQGPTPRFSLYLLAAGIVAGTANLIRGQSGTTVLVFLLSALLLDKKWMQKKFLFVVILLAGFLIPRFYFSYLFHQRDAFLQANQSDQLTLSKRHQFWHSAYIGLSFLTNEYNIPSGDQGVIGQMRERKPDVLIYSDEYDRMVKQEVLQVVRHHIYFVMRTLFSKAGNLLLYLFMFAHVGLIAGYMQPKGRSAEIPFWLAMGFGALPGLLVTPYLFYVFGFVTLAALYSILSVDHFFTHAD